MAALLKKNGITPIFFTICPINLTINPAFRETNAYIRTASDIKEELYFDDKVHPNAEGHQMIFNRIKMDCPFLF